MERKQSAIFLSGQPFLFFRSSWTYQQQANLITSLPILFQLCSLTPTVQGNAENAEI